MGVKPYKVIRDFLFSAVNKEFFVFLFFLAVSAGFWFMTVLNETTEKEIPVPVQFIGVPHNIVITEPLPDTIRVVVRDKGFVLMSYLHGDIVKPLKINFTTYARGNGKGSVTISEVQKTLGSMFYASSKIVSVKPEKMDFLFNFGMSKIVKAHIDGIIRPADTYYLARTAISPDSIKIYATQAMLDSIKELFTENIDLVGFKDTITKDIPLKKIKGVKMVPDHIKATFFPDMLTEKVVQVPIVSVNMPDGLVLRTFPTKVNVKVVAGRSRIDAIRPESFSVVVDYDDVATHPSDKCSLILRTVPNGIANASLEMQQVDYLIENIR
jgi:hypothetical protein